MAINSSNITPQIPQQLQQPQQQQVTDRHAFGEELTSREQSQHSVETTPAPDENQRATSDYTNLIREARAQQTTTHSVQTADATNEGGQTPDLQHIAITAYQNNQESYEAPTSSGQLLPRIDAIV